MHKKLKVVSFVSLACISLALVASFVLAAENASTPQKYTLISSNKLAHVHPFLRRSISILFPNNEETYLEYTDPQAKKYIQELDIKFVPFVIYDESVSSSDSFFHMVKHKMVSKNNIERFCSKL